MKWNMEYGMKWNMEYGIRNEMEYGIRNEMEYGIFRKSASTARFSRKELKDIFFV
jgi:hypothetical protein